MITLVLGGTRSGKSAVAETLADRLPGPVVYLATGVVTDDDMSARVETHRVRRPASWTTMEVGAELATALATTDGTVLVDSLGSWVAATPDFGVDIDALRRALSGRAADTVIVSEEVGLGVHAPTEVGRLFVDVLGQVNTAVAGVADRVLLVVAGRVLPLERFE